MRPAALLHGDLPALAALVPPALWLASQDAWFAPRLLFCAALALGWQALFAARRGQGMGLSALVSAGLVALLVPASAPFWQLALGVSFGQVLGEAVFGGRGRNFVQPVALALAFMAFSFPDQPWREGPALPAATAWPALVLLTAVGQARLTVLAGVAAGLAGLLWLIAPAQIPALFGAGAVLLGVAYLTADPVVAGATPASRIAYGLLAGALTALFATSGPAFGALVFATLLAQVFAPLIDHIAIAAHTGLMRRRAGRLRRG